MLHVARLEIDWSRRRRQIAYYRVGRGVGKIGALRSTAECGDESNHRLGFVAVASVLPSGRLQPTFHSGSADSLCTCGNVGIVDQAASLLRLKNEVTPPLTPDHARVFKRPSMRDGRALL